MALSDLAVRKAKAKATGKAYTLSDLDGLSLAVAPGGGEAWHFRYQWFGRQRRMSQGSYPEVSLRDARTLRDEARALLARDVNPHANRKQKRFAAKLNSENTFKAVFLKWLAHRGLSFDVGRQTSQSLISRIFANDVLPPVHLRSQTNGSARGHRQHRAPHGAFSSRKGPDLVQPVVPLCPGGRARP